MIGRSTTRSTGRKAIRPIRSLVAGGQLVAYGGGGSASSKVCASINAATVVAEQTNRSPRTGLDRLPLRLARAVAVVVEAGCFCAGPPQDAPSQNWLHQNCRPIWIKLARKSVTHCPDPCLSEGRAFTGILGNVDGCLTRTQPK